MSTAPPAAPVSRWQVLVPFVLIVLVWGTPWVVIRTQLGVVPPSWSVVYRFAVAVVTMVLWVAATRQPARLGGRGHLIALAVGVLQFAVNFNLIYRAAAYITSGLIAVTFALLLVPNAVLARIFLGQRIGWSFVMGGTLGIAGIALLFSHEFGTGLGAERLLAGVALTLGAVMASSIANVLQATEQARQLPPAATLGWAMFYGVLFDAGFAWHMSGPPVVDWRPEYLLGALYLGVVATALTFPLYFGLLKRLGPARTAYSSVLIPVVAMGISTLVEGYRWTPLAIGGGVLALAGLVIALRARNPAR